MGVSMLLYCVFGALPLGVYECVAVGGPQESAQGRRETLSN